MTHEELRLEETRLKRAHWQRWGLVEENRRRDKQSAEFELMDTGVFSDDRYFDVTVEYAKGHPEDILVRITVTNHGPERSEIHLLPTVDDELFDAVFDVGRVVGDAEQAPQISLIFGEQKVRIAVPLEPTPAKIRMLQLKRTIHLA